MRALVLHEFGRLTVESRPTPVPGPGEVLIRVAVTGICGSDIHGFTGENGRRVPGQVMGHESAGTVAALGPTPPGSEVPHFEIGAPVTFNPVVLPPDELESYAGREQHSPHKSVIGVAPAVSAAFAEYLVVPTRNVVPLPAALPLAVGALIEPLAVAVHAVRRAGVLPGHKVAVFGGGPIGQSVVLALAMAGCESVVVSEVDPARRELLARLGAETIDPAHIDIAEAVADRLGSPADIAIDAVGVDATVASALAATRLGGSVCLVGMGSRRLAIDAYAVSTDERTIIGSFTYSFDDFRDAVDWIAGSAALASRLITREVSMDEANDAFVGLARGDGTPGKVLVRMDS